MKQIFYYELKCKCDEIKKDLGNLSAIEKMISAYEKMIHLSEIAWKEGFLLLEKSLEDNTTDADTDVFLKEMITLILDGTGPENVYEMGINRCIAWNLPAYDGLICLLYLKGSMMILAGTHPRELDYYLKSMFPRNVLQIIEDREVGNNFPWRVRQEKEDNERIAALCKESEIVDEHNHSVSGQLSIILSKLSNKEIQKILRNTDLNDLSIVMKGMPGVVRKVIFDNISVQVGARVAENMEYMGPVLAKNVEGISARMLQIYISLVENDEISVEYEKEVKLVLDIYHTIQQQNQDLKERYHDMKQAIDRLYNQ